MPGTKQWTLEELHGLPDDGNKYELVRGELFVTPAPTNEHETILACLTRILDPYVAAQNLGLVYRPRAVFRFDKSEVVPDLMVRQPVARGRRDWDEAPTPILIVELLSPSTRRRDNAQKRDFYLDGGVAEYWIADADRRDIRVVRPDKNDAIATDTLTWAPDGATASLTVALRDVFCSV